MKLQINSITISVGPYGTWPELYQAFISEEEAAGRPVPKYSWETALAVAAGWLLKKALDELFNYAINWKERRRELERQNKLDETAKQRHEELLRRIDALSKEQANSIQGNNVESKLSILNSLPSKPIIILEGETEGELVSALREKLCQTGIEISVCGKKSG